ncbi:zinc metalloprotease HtpX [archaeon]|nr:zinc metalloprotease HtpX [archaeon]
MINQLKTILLLGALTALLLWVGTLWGISGMLIAGIFVILMNLVMYFYSDKLVLAMYKAKQVNGDSQPKLFNIAKKVAHQANIPLPKTYIIETKTPNAFATGRSPKHASIACTSGILELLTDKELEGVIAHEIAHIRNRDILIATIAATIAGIVSYIAMMAQWAAIFGGGERREGGSNLIGLLVLIIVVPIAATIIQLAISRTREYQADNSGAKIIKNPNSLADALEKLEAGVKSHPLRHGNQATASLFIVNPFSAKGLLTLFSTHPPIDERVKRLRLMAV